MKTLVLYEPGVWQDFVVALVKVAETPQGEIKTKCPETLEAVRSETETEKPDLVIIDWYKHKKDSLTAIRETAPQAKIIALTGSDDDANEATQMGADSAFHVTDVAVWRFAEVLRKLRLIPPPAQFLREQSLDARTSSLVR